ncbi:hypothetical protein [Undibacterium sp.]|uniref:hypothetical protein n=1 Tax=Undibacterium sp. TaxID=1914977 RepID=UPI003750D6BB
MLTKQGKHYYGESQADLPDEITRYSKLNGYPAQYFSDAICTCGASKFRLELDENEGAAVRHCVSCGGAHPIGDSGEYLEGAELEECGCPCGNDDLEITVGVALYDQSNDVRWLYIGCRCPVCSLAAVYGDWKNEFSGFRALLDQV